MLLWIHPEEVGDVELSPQSAGQAVRSEKKDPFQTWFIRDSVCFTFEWSPSIEKGRISEFLLNSNQQDLTGSEMTLAMQTSSLWQ